MDAVTRAEAEVLAVEVRAICDERDALREERDRYQEALEKIKTQESARRARNIARAALGDHDAKEGPA